MRQVHGLQPSSWTRFACRFRYALLRAWHSHNQHHNPHSLRPAPPSPRLDYVFYYYSELRIILDFADGKTRIGQRWEQWAHLTTHELDYYHRCQLVDATCLEDWRRWFQSRISLMLALVYSKPTSLQFQTKRLPTSTVTALTSCRPLMMTLEQLQFYSSEASSLSSKWNLCSWVASSAAWFSYSASWKALTESASVSAASLNDSWQQLVLFYLDWLPWYCYCFAWQGYSNWNCYQASWWTHRPLIQIFSFSFSPICLSWQDYSNPTMMIFLWWIGSASSACLSKPSWHSSY